MRFSRRWLALNLVVAASPALAQGVSGRVVDATNSTPLPGVVVTLARDSGKVRLILRTNDSGRFQTAAPAPGAYTLELKRVGYLPRSVVVQLETGKTLSGSYALTRSPQQIDTVRTKDSTMTTLFHLTPGREQMRKHMLLDAGQFVSGLELRQSKLSVMEFLGTIPGLRFVPDVPAALMAPVIPATTGYLISAYTNKCLYGRIDRWSIIGLLDQNRADGIDELITVDDVMGVELYQPGEVPPDWKAEASIDHLVWHIGNAGRSYIIGDSGWPKTDRLGAVPKLGDFVAPPGCIGPVLPKGVKSLEELSVPICFLGRNTKGVPTANTSFNMGGITPKCGFVQIWTRVAW